jgi:hypothetical protein
MIFIWSPRAYSLFDHFSRFNSLLRGCRVVRSGSGSIRSSYSFSRRTAEMRNALRIFLHQCYVLRRFVVQQSLVVLPIQEVSADISLCRPLPVLVLEACNSHPEGWPHYTENRTPCALCSEFICPCARNIMEIVRCHLPVTGHIKMTLGFLVCVSLTKQIVSSFSYFYPSFCLVKMTLCASEKSFCYNC